MPVTRRSFLKNTAAATMVSAAGGAVSTVLGKSHAVSSNSGLNKWRGRVAVNFNKNAVTDYTKKEVDSEVVEKMVDDTILKLSDATTVGDAWKNIFPSTLTATSKIAIKTNFYALSICVPPEVLLAIVKGLRKMTIDGTPYTGDITIYEANTNNGFEQAGYDTSAFSADEVNAKLVKGSMGSGSDPAEGESKYVSLLDDADFLFNVFSARGHDAYTEGVSLGFKSHYGTYINQPMSSIHSPTKFSQRVRNLHCTGAISKKQVLSISCAFYCNNEKDSMGSTGRKSFETYVKTIDAEATCESPSTLIMSTDAVSCEMQAIKVLRLNKGKEYGSEDMPNYLKASAGVEGALTDTTYNIGEIDESLMDVRKIVNGTYIGSTATTQSPDHRNTTSSVNLTIKSLPSARSTYFEFKLPPQLKGSNASLTFFTISGQQIFQKNLTVRGVLNNFSWNHKSTRGSVVKGRYVAELKAGQVSCRKMFLIV